MFGKKENEGELLNEVAIICLGLKLTSYLNQTFAKTNNVPQLG